jgi:hypothetical protein
VFIYNFKSKDIISHIKNLANFAKPKTPACVILPKEDDFKTKYKKLILNFTENITKNLVSYMLLGLFIAVQLFV